MTRAVVRDARPDELTACQAVRQEVFVAGQGVPADLEQDGRDGEAHHVVALVDDVIVGTARMRPYGNPPGTLFKVERVAVLASQRGTGLGKELMHHLERLAHTLGAKGILLNAQADVIAFYEGLGYRGEGERFFEAGIEHLAMTRSV